jgi:hypothetical protein
MIRRGLPQAAAALCCITAALALAACSSSNALTTGALFGSGGPAKPAEPKLVTATDRALHVATTSARATRCGYVFDPAAVRTAYLAFEAGQGGPADQLAKVEKSYDYTLGTVMKGVSGSEDYCTDEQTAVIKRDLNKVLAGDFAPPSKRPDVGWGWGTPSSDKLDREKVFHPSTIR